MNPLECIYLQPSLGHNLQKKSTPGEKDVWFHWDHFRNAWCWTKLNNSWHHFNVDTQIKMDSPQLSTELRCLVSPQRHQVTDSDFDFQKKKGRKSKMTYICGRRIYDLQHNAGDLVVSIFMYCFYQIFFKPLWCHLHNIQIPFVLCVYLFKGFLIPDCYLFIYFSGTNYEHHAWLRLNLRRFKNIRAGRSRRKEL